MNDSPDPAAGPSTPPAAAGRIGEVFLVFLRLGLTSFGGPVAHLGYFREALVQRRRWLDDGAYADIVALCQFLPGPASSQVGMALGLRRAGFGGMLAAWLGFTLPSAALMVAFAFGIDALGDLSRAGWIGGLKAAAVAVVAYALFGMARSLAPDAPRAAIATGAMLVALALPGALAQLGAIGLAGAVGLFWLRDPGGAASAGTAPAAMPADASGDPPSRRIPHPFLPRRRPRATGSPDGSASPAWRPSPSCCSRCPPSP